MSILPSVLAQFEAVNPRAAALLSVVDSSGLEFCRTQLGEENLRDRRGCQEKFLHSQTGALLEAQYWFNDSVDRKTDMLVVFGLGLGWQYRALTFWLEARKNRRLIILEDDLAIINAFLHTPMAEEFFANPNVTLLYLEEGEEKRQTLQIVAWNVYQHKWQFIPSPAYKRYRSDLFQALHTELSVLQVDTSSVLNEFMTFGEGQLRNFGRNLFLWRKSLNGASLFGQFHCPAIVTAAGPSLDKDIAWLRTVGSRALILAGGSSIGALLQGGVMPHFGATVDPNPMQYVRLRQVQPFCVPLFYRSRALHEALMFHQGPLLYLKGGDGYPLVEWFEKSLGVHGETLDGGDSVSNLLIELAYRLGCRPIIMVGYDLAYTGGARYTAKVSESLALKEKIAFTGETRGELVTGKTNRGADVQTEAKWMIEAHWIERFHRLHPRLQLINTAVDGLAIGNTTPMPLQEALETFCQKPHDIDGLVHVGLQEAKPINPSLEEVGACFETMSSSFVTVQKLLDRLLIEMGKNDQFSEDSPEIASLLYDLSQQEAFSVALRPFDAMHKKLSMMRRLLECRPSTDEAKLLAFERNAWKERSLFLNSACSSHLSFFFSMVAWACLNGHPLPKALSLTPWPPEVPRLPKGFLS